MTDIAVTTEALDKIMARHRASLETLTAGMPTEVASDYLADQVAAEKELEALKEAAWKYADLAGS